MNIPLVSVIIVNWNGARYLRACLTALYQQTYTPIEILIIDNASTDTSCQVIETFQQEHHPPNNEGNMSDLPALRLICNVRNEGFCRGNNQGIRLSGGEFALLLNADVTLDVRFISQLVTIMQSDPTVGIALGKLLRGSPPRTLDSTGIVIRKNRRAFDRGQGEVDTGQYDRAEEVFGASGAACLCRRTMLDAIKYGEEYLDELFFAYKEDIDLSWRARLYGWKCVYTPEAVGQHDRTWSTTQRRAAIPKWIRRHSLKNQYLLILKNDRWQTVWPHIVPILWFELRSLGYLLLREPYVLTVFGDLLRRWSEIMKRRAVIQRAAQNHDSSRKILKWFR